MNRSQQISLDDTLLEYLLASSEPLPAGIAGVAERALEMGMPSMHVSPDQALLMRFLVRLVGAERILEIGTFLGLSALALADGMGPGGTLVCVDSSEEWTAHAVELWAAAGVSDRIDLRLGDAHGALRDLDPGETFDVVFIDADKGGYLDYLDQVAPRLRRGGLLMVDNTLWSGRVADPADTAPDTEALRRFNEALVGDDRFDVAIIAVGDGLTLARRR